MFGLDYIMKNMVTCILSTDPEARWLMLSGQGWASEVTPTLTMTSTGQQERRVLNWILQALHIQTEGTAEMFIWLHFSFCCSRLQSVCGGCTWIWPRSGPEALQKPSLADVSHLQILPSSQPVINRRYSKYQRALQLRVLIIYLCLHSYYSYILVTSYINVCWCMLGPARGRPNHLPRYGWGFQSRVLLLPRLMQSRCAPDVTFDAVSTLGDATFFFRERFVDDLVVLSSAIAGLIWALMSVCCWFDHCYITSQHHTIIFDLPYTSFPTRYLWIKHNEQYDIKEGPISNFMPKIETRIDAAFWVPRRSTAYLIHGKCLEYFIYCIWC